MHICLHCETSASLSIRGQCIDVIIIRKQVVDAGAEASVSGPGVFQGCNRPPQQLCVHAWHPLVHSKQRRGQLQKWGAEV